MNVLPVSFLDVTDSIRFGARFFDVLLSHYCRPGMFLKCAQCLEKSIVRAETYGGESVEKHHYFWPSFGQSDELSLGKLGNRICRHSDRILVKSHANVELNDI